MLSAIDQTGHFIIPLYGRSCARGWKWNSAIEFVHLPFHPRLARLRDLSTLDRKAWIQLRLIPRGDSKIRIDIEKLGPFVTSSWYRLLLSTNRFVSIRKRQAFPSFSSSSSSCQKGYRQVSAHIRMYTDFRSIVDERDSILLGCFIGDYSSRNGGILINISWGGDWE